MPPPFCRRAEFSVTLDMRGGFPYNRPMATENEIKNHVTLELNNLLQSAKVTATPEQIGKTAELLLKSFYFLEIKFNPDSTIFDYEDKTTQSAHLLGIDKKTYIEKAALKQSQLFCLPPKTINAKIEGAAQLLGIDKKTYVEKAALKQPSLFYLSPETIYKKYKFIKGAHAAGFITNTESTIESVMDYPTVLTRSTKNTALRTAHTAMTGQIFKLSTFFAGRGRNNKMIETEVVSWLKDQFERTGFGDQVARNMHRNGLISELPDWAAEPRSP
ncbi:MAG: hypothetical protein IT559_02990 [Alphaproteobacteria bacterium]|nr:hypothetical protein [Alphaproteobacteria bacterium]